MFLGPMHKKITVTYDGVVLDEFERNDDVQIVTSHVLQIATLWNYGASYEKGLDGKPLPRKTQMVFKVILQKIWGFRPRYKASTSETVKYQATDPNSPVEKYWAEVLASNNP